LKLDGRKSQNITFSFLPIQMHWPWQSGSPCGMMGREDQLKLFDEFPLICSLLSLSNFELKLTVVLYFIFSVGQVYVLSL